nr:hypothetical protein [Desulfobacterales bacterium]
MLIAERGTRAFRHLNSFLQSINRCPLELRKKFEIYASCFIVLGILGMVAGTAGVFFNAPPVYADDQVEDTALSGTSGPDIITIPSGDFLNAIANIATDSGEKIEASATGVDSLDGNDEITAELGATLSSNAIASALIIQDPKKTEAIAKSKTVSAGDGDDTVTTNTEVDADASGTGAYGAMLTVNDDDQQDDQKKLDVSITQKSNATGISGDDGEDTITTNSTIDATAGSLTGAGDFGLEATVTESMKIDVGSTSEATSAGIDTGEDKDTIFANQAVTAASDATAGALTVGVVAGSPDKKTQIEFSADAKATATATGIEAGAEGEEDSSEDASPFGLDGLKVTYEKTVSTTATDDTVTSNSTIDAIADANAGAAGLGVSAEVTGSAKTSANAAAKAESTGVSTGGGSDNVTTNGVITSDAVADAGAVSVNIAVGNQEKDTSGDGSDSGSGSNGDPDKKEDDEEDSKPSSSANATAEAKAVGIDAESDGHTKTDRGSAEITESNLRIEFERTEEALAGDDEVTSNAGISATASSASSDKDVAIEISSSGSAETETKSESSSSATGIYTGLGNDTVTSEGAIEATADANASAMSASISVALNEDDSQTQDPPPGGDGTNTDSGSGNVSTTDEDSNQQSKDERNKLNSKTDAGVTAKAEATGIDAEGSGHKKSTSGTLYIDKDGLSLTGSRSNESQGGDDTVISRGTITSSGTALANSANVGISINATGSVESKANATATAESTGVTTGGGSDKVTSEKAVSTLAVTEAGALAVGLTVSQKKEKSRTNGGNGTGTDDNQDNPPAENPFVLDNSEIKTETKATAKSTATGIDTEDDDHLSSDELALSITREGLLFNYGSERSTLAGNDEVTSKGPISAQSFANSATLSASISIQAEGSIDSNATSAAETEATGIYTGGGNDTIESTQTIDALSISGAEALAVSVSVSKPESDNDNNNDNNDNPPDPVKPLKVKGNSVANAEAASTAVGINSEGSGHQTRKSHTVDFNQDGLAVNVVSDQSSVAGDDTVSQSGQLTATAIAGSAAGAGDIRVGTEGDASSKANSEAKATTGGILTGGGADTVTADGVIISTANADAAALAVTVAQGGDKAKAEAKSTAEATARGVSTAGTDKNTSMAVGLLIDEQRLTATVGYASSSDDGNDTVSGSANINTAAVAVSGAVGVAVNIDGASDVNVQSIAKGMAEAVASGGGDDTITTGGDLKAGAWGKAGALGVRFGQNGEVKKKSKVKLDTKATAEASATGIASDDDSASRQVDSTLTIDPSGLNLNFTLDAQETASIGDDEIINTGGIDASAFSTSGALGVDIKIDGAAEADVKSTAKSNATGIDAGGGIDVIDSSGGLAATAASNAGSLGVSFGQNTDEKTKPKVSVKAAAAAEAEATGIAANTGKDVVTDVDFTIDASGLAASFRHETVAAGGDDTVTSEGEVEANALSNSGVGAASVAIDGAASVDVNAQATSQATVIETGGGNDGVTSNGDVISRATSFSNAIAASVGVKSSDGSKAQAKVEGETTAEATATGISTDGGGNNALVDFSLNIDDSGITAAFEKSSSAASGDDTVVSSGSIETRVIAESGLAAVPVSVKGSAQAQANTTAKAEATGINTGGGADFVDNTATIDVGKTIATDFETFLNDINTYIKDEHIDTDIDTHTDPDIDTIIDSVFDPDIGTLAFATTANVAVTTEGTAVANSGFLDAGTKATSDAVGITTSGSSQDDSLTVASNIDFDSFGVTVDVVSSTDGVTADGADTIFNSGDISVSSLSGTAQANVGVSAGENKGLALTIGRSESEATANGIASGHADDFIDNSATIDAEAKAFGVMGNVAVTNKGLAVAGNAAWDGGT